MKLQWKYNFIRNKILCDIIYMNNKKNKIYYISFETFYFIESYSTSGSSSCLCLYLSCSALSPQNAFFSFLCIFFSLSLSFSALPLHYIWNTRLFLSVSLLLSSISSSWLCLIHLSLSLSRVLSLSLSVLGKPQKKVF